MQPVENPQRLSHEDLDQLVARIGHLERGRDAAREQLKEQVTLFGWMRRHLRTPLFDIWYKDGRLTIMERDEPEPPADARAVA